MQVQVSFEQRHGGKLRQVVLICLQQHQSWGQKGSGGERLHFPSGQTSMLTVWGNVNRQYTAIQGEGICTCLKSWKVQWPCFSTWELTVLYDKIKMAAAQVMLQFFADLVREKAYLTPYPLRQQKPSRKMQKGWDSWNLYLPIYLQTIKEECKWYSLTFLGEGERTLCLHVWLRLQWNSYCRCQCSL